MAYDDSKPRQDAGLSVAPATPGSNKIAPKDGKPDDKGAKAKTLGTKKAKQREQDILARMRKRFERCCGAEAENRKAMADDARFLAGEQWDPKTLADRAADNRPSLTINKLPTFVDQVVNAMREERPAINVNPNGDKSDVQAAKMYRGLIRHIERASAAEIAYDTGFENAVARGLGYWRVLTKYESPETHNQCIRIERIRNIFTVYLDPDRMEPDGADARYGFITEMIPRDEYDEQYSKFDPVAWDLAGQGDSYKLWSTKDEVRVAEYFEIENETRTLLLLSNGREVWEDEIADEIRKLIDAGTLTIERTRESQCPKVCWYKATAKNIISEKEWIGSSIPIVPVTGHEYDVEGKVRYSGIVRFAKDAQKMYNYWKTKETEAIALAPNAPWVIEEGQIEGHESEWESANRRPIPVLQYKGTTIGGSPAPPPQRQQFAGVPAGIVQATAGAAQDMMATTGIRFDATVQDHLYDESGRALREHRRSGDIGSFHYVDNLARSLKRTGEILIEIIPKVYDTRRVMTILREDDTEERITIDPDAGKPITKTVDPETGKKMKVFNPTIGKYGVTVMIGPSYATKRVEAAESMMDFTRALPMVGEMISDLVAKNQDWPGAQEMATRLAKAIAMKYPGIISPEMEDVSPQVQAILTQLQQQLQHMTQERVQLLKALQDQTADRAIEKDKIDNDFEAKILKIVSDIETKSAATQEKAIANYNTHINAQIKTMGDHVMQLREILTRPPEKEPAPKERSERHSDTEKYHKEMIEALGGMSEKLTEAVANTNRRPKGFKIVRGKDGMAAGAQVDYGDG